MSAKKTENETFVEAEDTPTPEAQDRSSRNRDAVEMSVDVNAARRKELLQDAEDARERQAQLLRVLKKREQVRETAPDSVIVMQSAGSPRDTLVAMWRANGLVHEDETVFFDDKEQHGKHLGEGWEPIEDRGRHLNDRGDLAYKRPKEITRLIKGESKALSRAMLSEVGKALADADPGNEILKQNVTGYAPQDWGG